MPLSRLSVRPDKKKQKKTKKQKQTHKSPR